MKKLTAFWLVLVLFLPGISQAYPGEVKGTVTRVIDGDTIDIRDFGRVRLADINCPEIDRPGGIKAKAYTTKHLLGKKVYLDVDNKTGKDDYNRSVCLVYLAKRGGSLDESKNFNRMIIDSGYACVLDFYNNEFNPSDWWGGLIPCSVCIKGHVETAEESAKSGPLSACGKLVGSEKSNQYHYPACKLAKKIRPDCQIWFSSSKDARAHGYVRCKACKPP